MHFLRLVILALLVGACSCGNHSFRSELRIGIDPNWYPIDFSSQTSYVNGFTEDLLLEMARYSGMQFELVRTNWDNLFDGMREGKYDAVFTTLPPYEHNVAKYDFSENILDLGPVLIVPNDSKTTDLKKLDGELVGIITGDPAEWVLAKYPTIIIRQYNSIPDLLSAAAKGDIQAALLDQIPAVSYVGDLFQGTLKIVGEPFTPAGIHLIGPKGSIYTFNKYLTSLRKKNILEKLKKKWELIHKSITSPTRGEA